MGRDRSPAVPNMSPELHKLSRQFSQQVNTLLLQQVLAEPAWAKKLSGIWFCSIAYTITENGFTYPRP